MTWKMTHPKYGWGWRVKGKVLQRMVTEEVQYPSGPIEEFCTRLREMAVQYEEAEVSLEQEYGSYGDRDQDFLAVRGWRRATPEEIQEADDKLTAAAENQDRWEARQITQLRESHPELFKEET